ncbi:MAG: glycosyltransferase family 2 protein, partial [Candidatus Omnitrophota bacterium]
RYHLILNPDIIIKNGSIEKMLDHMESDPDIGILTPKMVYENGEIQYSCRRFPTLASFITRGTAPGVKNGLMRRYLMMDKKHDQIMDVDWGLGSCLLARKEVLDQLNGFDEKFFMYYEDIDLCFRAGIKGWRVVYFPYAEVIHSYKRDSAKRGMNRLKYVHAMSAIRFFCKHLLRRGWKTFYA